MQNQNKRLKNVAKKIAESESSRRSMLVAKLSQKHEFSWKMQKSEKK